MRAALPAKSQLDSNGILRIPVCPKSLTLAATSPPLIPSIKCCMAAADNIAVLAQLTVLVLLTPLLLLFSNL